MSFGREDLILEGRPIIDDVDRLLRLLRNVWPNAVAAQADREIEETVSLQGPDWPTIRHWKEFFICADAQALHSWIDRGAVSENADTMVHILVNRDSLTAVVDERDGFLGRQLTNVLTTIRREREFHPALSQGRAA